MKTHRWLLLGAWLMLGVFLGGCDSGGSDPEEDLDDTPAHAVNGSWLRMKLDGRDWNNFLEVNATVFTTSNGTPFWLSVSTAAAPQLPIIGRVLLLTTTLDEGFLAPEDYSTQVLYTETADADQEVVYLGEGVAVQIEVVERTAEVVKGRFSATLTLEDGNGTLSITEGVFVANIDETRVLPLP